MNSFDSPHIYGLFQKRIEGDDALLQLASARFKRMCIGAEFYAETIDELWWLIGFNPMDTRLPIVHLGREIDLFKELDRNLILNFATSFQNKIYGIVIHDQVEIETKLDKYLQILREIDLLLEKINNPPYIFIEYAVGLPFELYVSIFKNIIDAKKVSACIDTGHIGIKQAKIEYARSNYGKDICNVDLYDLLNPIVKEKVDLAIQSALPALLEIVNDLNKLSKPLHFHLHDGHPSWRSNPFGLSDHFGFMENMVLDSRTNKSLTISPMYGVHGLSDIVTNSLEVSRVNQISYTLEIHPLDKKLSLGKFSYMFNHWHDKTNAEKMNHWIFTLEENYKVLIENIRC